MQNTGLERLARGIRLLVLDVDGVMTDGSVTYSTDGHELKTFNIKDGLGIKMIQQAGIRTAIITGRKSSCVERRARELGIADLVQGREDKLVALEALCQQQGLRLEECAYMGDDLPDLRAIRAAGLGLTVADAVDAVRESADWCSDFPGGRGAVRQACEWLLDLRQQRAAVEAGWH